MDKKASACCTSYLQMLSGFDDLILPKVDVRADHVWHLFVIRTKHRDALKAYLAENGIQTMINYPVALLFLMLMRIRTITTMISNVLWPPV